MTAPTNPTNEKPRNNIQTRRRKIVKPQASTTRVQRSKTPENVAVTEDGQVQHPTDHPTDQSGFIQKSAINRTHHLTEHDLNMTNADQTTTAIINLTPAQADKIRTIARAQNKNESAVIEQLMSRQLDLMPRQGPGHTRAEILSITKNSSLADIMDPNTLWDETILDRHHQWMTNEQNQPLLSEFTINNRSDIQHHYMEATFWQDAETPHRWRAMLVPQTQDIGELGDLPEQLYPHLSLHAAAESLYQAYAERHGTPDPAQALRRTLQEILHNNQIYAQHGTVVHQSDIQDLHPEVDIDLLCQCLADNLGEPDDAIEDYMTVAGQLPA